MLFGRRKPGYTTTVDGSVDPEQAVLELQKAELAAKKKPKLGGLIRKGIVFRLRFTGQKIQQFRLCSIGLRSFGGFGCGLGGLLCGKLGGLPLHCGDHIFTGLGGAAVKGAAAAALITPHALLLEKVENADELLAQMPTDPQCTDIVTRAGAKDTYYYSNANMSDNYAMIAQLIEDKDLCVMFAEMVRFNARIYPSATPLKYFQRSPYAPRYRHTPGSPEKGRAAGLWRKL